GVLVGQHGVVQVGGDEIARPARADQLLHPVQGLLERQGRKGHAPDPHSIRGHDPPPSIPACGLRLPASGMDAILSPPSRCGHKQKGRLWGSVMKSLRIVIVNYRTPGLVIDCLRSLATEIPPGSDWRVVVVENASGDDSAAKIGAAIRGEGWDAWAE